MQQRFANELLHVTSPDSPIYFAGEYQIGDV